MARVYRHLAGPDDYVGRVEENGRVYGQRVGPDERLGRMLGSRGVLIPSDATRLASGRRPGQLRHGLNAGSGIWYDLILQQVPGNVADVSA